MSSAERCYSQARYTSYILHHFCTLPPSFLPSFCPSLLIRLVALQLSLLKESSGKEVINLDPRAVSKFVEEQPFIEASVNAVVI